MAFKIYSLAFFILKEKLKKKKLVQMLSICDFEASGGVKHYCMYLYDSFLEWFTAFRPPYISSGAAVRAMGVRTPPGAAARPRLCVCLYVGELVGEREEGTGG